MTSQSSILQRCRSHLAEAGESYGEHFRFALTVALLTMAAGLACLIHAIVPALCTRTASTIIGRLQSLFANRGAQRAVWAQSSGAVVFGGLIALSGLTTLLPVASGGGFLLGVIVGALAFAVPLAYLLSNPELEPVQA